MEDFSRNVPACRRLKDALRAKQINSSQKDMKTEIANGEIEDELLQGTQTKVIHDKTCNHSNGADTEASPENEVGQGSAKKSDHLSDE